MFPIRDDNSDRRITPFVNYAFLGLNILVFLLLQQLGSNEAFTYAFSLVPQEITTGTDIVGPRVVSDAVGNSGSVLHYASPLPVYFNFLSSMFMHGDLMHLGGNLLFLWIFGDNIEDKIGHTRYAVFYVLCGFGAAVAQIALGPGSIIPMLGASGAISGIMGGYVLLFPHRRVTAFVLRFLMEVPAYAAVGIWIVYQLVLGYLTPSDTGGVAYAAHIGGFFAGLALIKLFAIGK